MKKQILNFLSIFLLFNSFNALGMFRKRAKIHPISKIKHEKNLSDLPFELIHNGIFPFLDDIETFENIKMAHKEIIDAITAHIRSLDYYGRELSENTELKKLITKIATASPNNPIVLKCKKYSPEDDFNFAFNLADYTTEYEKNFKIPKKPKNNHRLIKKPITLEELYHIIAEITKKHTKRKLKRKRIVNFRVNKTIGNSSSIISIVAGLFTLLLFFFNIVLTIISAISEKKKLHKARNFFMALNAILLFFTSISSCCCVTSNRCYRPEKTKPHIKPLEFLNKLTEKASYVANIFSAIDRILEKRTKREIQEIETQLKKIEKELDSLSIT